MNPQRIFLCILCTKAELTGCREEQPVSLVVHFIAIASEIYPTPPPFHTSSMFYPPQLKTVLLL